MTSYLRYLFPALWAWAHWRWLWSRQYTVDDLGRVSVVGDDSPPYFIYLSTWGIKYKEGWGPWKFLVLVYWWDYLLGTLMGYGVCSVSRGAHLLGKRHWRMTGPPLWGIKPLRPEG